MYGKETSFMYSIKSVMKDMPYTFLFISFMIPIIYCAFFLRMFERPLQYESFNNIINCMWCIIITMTTVGYGDISPLSHNGKILAIVVSIWGVFVVSLFVVTLTNMLIFTESEKKSFGILIKLQAKEELKLAAVNAMSSTYSAKALRKNETTSIMHLVRVVRKARKYRYEFKKAFA
jgi:hypothetical protein